jgi:hypothetical protein
MACSPLCEAGKCYGGAYGDDPSWRGARRALVWPCSHPSPPHAMMVFFVFPAQDIVTWKGGLYFIDNKDEPNPKPLVGSQIAFTKNGVLQGVAYRSVYLPAHLLSVHPFVCVDVRLPVCLSVMGAHVASLER